MNKKILISTLTGCALLPAAAFAVDRQNANITYNFVDIEYVSVEPKDVDEDATGWGGLVTLALHPNVHALAEYQSVENSFELDQYRVGLGANYTVHPMFDLVGQLTFESQDFAVADDSGWGARAQVRAGVLPNLELNAHARYVDIGDFGDDTLFGAGAIFYAAKAFGVGAEYEEGDDTTNWKVFARFNLPGIM